MRRERSDGLGAQNSIHATRRQRVVLRRRRCRRRRARALSCVCRAARSNLGWIGPRTHARATLVRALAITSTHLALGVLLEARVEDAIRNLVGQLIRVAFVHRLGGEKELCHGTLRTHRALVCVCVVLSNCRTPERAYAVLRVCSCIACPRVSPCVQRRVRARLCYAPRSLCQQCFPARGPAPPYIGNVGFPTVRRQIWRRGSLSSNPN